MVSSGPGWHTPIPRRADGQPRRVGIEIEFGGMDFDAACEVLAAWTGARPSVSSRAEARVETVHGTIKLEVDSRFVKRLALEGAETPPGGRKQWLSLLETVAGKVVPLEVVLPPVPLPRLDELESLASALAAAGAEGTDASLIAAYGLHLNVELPANTAPWLLAFTQAFGLIQHWLEKAYQVDLTRRLSPYVELWPDRYVLAALQLPDDASFEQQRALYLEHNPSRNRALDLWPLFAWQDPPWAAAAHLDPLVKARPALHLRLPNSELGKPGWQLSSAWQPWRAVEYLAQDLEGRCALAEGFRRRKTGKLASSSAFWVDRVTDFLSRYPGVVGRR